MPTKADHLRALACICRQFGGRLTILSQQKFDVLFMNSPHGFHSSEEGLQEAPFVDAHGLHWAAKVIYVVEGREKIGAIIHEMGHVFATCHPPLHGCATCHEWNWIGWEISLARQIGASRIWGRHNSDYVTNDKGLTWGALSIKRRPSIVANRIALARKNGLLGPHNAPRGIR